MINLNDLPKHILLEIMKNLDYFELKDCMGVNKNLNQLTLHTAFNKTLFRSVRVIPADGPVALPKMRVHPALDAMRFECSSEVEDFYVGTTMLTETSAADEQATNPPVAFLRLQIKTWKPVQASNKTGVTVMQVVKTLAKFFSNDKHYNSMGDHTGWTGFNEYRLDSKGRVVLRADAFDS